MRECVFDLGFFRREVFHFVNVGTGNKRFVARTGDDGCAQPVVLCKRVKCRCNSTLACHAQCVAARRIIDGQIGDASRVATIIDAGEQKITHLTSTRGIFSA